MRKLRSRIVSPATAGSPSDKPKHPADTDHRLDQSVATRPSPCLLSTPPSLDAGGSPRPGAAFPSRRRSLRLSPATVSGGVAEEAAEPPAQPRVDYGADRLSMTGAEEEKAMKGNIGGEDSGGGGKWRGKRKLEDDDGLVLMCLRSGKRPRDSGMAYGFVENVGSTAADTAGIGSSVSARFSRIANRIIESKDEVLNRVGVGLPRTRMNLRSADKGKGKVDELIDFALAVNGGAEMGRGKMVKNNTLPFDPLRRELEDFHWRMEMAANKVKRRRAARKGLGEQSSVDMTGRFRDIARQNASRFAHFNANDEPANGNPVEKGKGKGKVDELFYFALEVNRGAEKGKGKMVKKDTLQSDDGNLLGLDTLFRLQQLRQESDTFHQRVEIAANKVERKRVAREGPGESSSVDIRGRFGDIAGQNASRFAHFNAYDEPANDSPVVAAINADAAPIETNPVDMTYRFVENVGTTAANASGIGSSLSTQVPGVATGNKERKDKLLNRVGVGLPRFRMNLRSADKGKGKVDELIDFALKVNGGAEKGKGKMVKNDTLQSDDGNMMGFNSLFDPSVRLQQLHQESDTLHQQVEIGANKVKRKRAEREGPGEPSSVDMRGRFRDIARQNASRFAHFNANDDLPNDNPVEAAINADVAPGETNPEPEDWPGPFSTAVKIIKDRAAKMSSRHSSSTSSNKCKSAIRWTPNGEGCAGKKRAAPSLMELCLKVLAANADSITSLDVVPDWQRHKLCQILSDSRKMNKRFFELLLHGSPTELRIKDTSWLTEDELDGCFKECDTTNLTVLQLDQCGRCLPDYIISSSIARSPKHFPLLSTISITGACRLTDGGLASLISCTPALRSINLSQCSLLTYSSIETLAHHLGSVLKELYINDCQSFEATLLLPALKKLENLQVLSVGGIPSVSDDFIREFAALRGHNIRELILNDCTSLTDASIKAIAEACPGLLSLNLVSLTKLTDSAIGYLSSGCQAIEKLILRRNNLSDEAVAAFLETSGEQLQELSLNNIKMVGSQTALSISKQAKKLQILDLSWCRNLPDEALGLIVDSCFCLEELRVFGCTQITDNFLNGHSNEKVQIIGLRMTPFLEHCKALVPQNPF